MKGRAVCNVYRAGWRKVGITRPFFPKSTEKVRVMLTRSASSKYDVHTFKFYMHMKGWYDVQGQRWRTACCPRPSPTAHDPRFMAHNPRLTPAAHNGDGRCNTLFGVGCGTTLGTHKSAALKGGGQLENSCARTLLQTWRTRTSSQARRYLPSACSTATAQATVQPTMGLLPMPMRPIMSTCAGTDEEPANCALECMRPMVSVMP